MRYQIRILPHARRALSSLPIDAVRRIAGALQDLAEEQDPHSCVKRLRGHPALSSIRVGEYRVILSIDRGILVIFVIDAGDRRSVYRKI
jgi:mRNA interferase RelE/StbE